MKLYTHLTLPTTPNVVNPTFAEAAVTAYIEMQQRYLVGDWKPAELDGGRLCEAISRAVLQLDTGRVDHRRLPGKIQDRATSPQASKEVVLRVTRR